MQKFSDNVTDANGKALAGVSVTVFNAGLQTKPTIYSDNGITSTANPLTTTDDGDYAFYVANGRYDLVLSLTGYTFTATDTSDFIAFDAAAAGGGIITVVAGGGTGDATLAIHGVLIGAGTSPVVVTAVGASNTFLKGNTGADPTFQTVTLASSDFVNQGTTTTVLHGNAAGNPSFGQVTLTTDVTGILAITNGGIGIASGTSGGILGFTGTTTLASSVLLTANALVLGAGAGATPTPMGSLGTTTTLLHGNVAGAPTFGGVSLANDTSANQGTTTTVLHGNAAGQPSFASVVEADLNLTDLTTANAAVGQHGLLKKLSNVATQFMDGTGNWSTPAGGAGATLGVIQALPYATVPFL